MRTSFTLPTNFSKVIVNHPASLQQRQGLTIEQETLTDLAWLYKTLRTNFETSVNEKTPNLIQTSSPNQNSQTLEYLLKISLRDFNAALKELQQHSKSNRFTLKFLTEDSRIYTLYLIDSSKHRNSKEHIISSETLRIETIQDLNRALSELSKNLPEIVKKNSRLMREVQKLISCFSV